MATLCLLFQLYNAKRIRIYTQHYVCAYFSKIIIKIICQLLGRGCDFFPPLKAARVLAKCEKRVFNSF